MKLVEIRINGLWGDKNLHINFFDDFNFLIGFNGTGKTTVFNIITGMLRFDLDFIVKSDFSSASLSFVSADKINYRIEFNKNIADDGELFLEYSIVNEDTSKDVFRSRHILSNYEKQDDNYRYRSMIRRNRNIDELNKFMNANISMIWLPIGRFNPESERELRNSSYGNSVDMRLGEVLDNFIKYSSLINKNISLEMDLFQKDILLSSIDSDYTEGLTDLSSKLDGEGNMDRLMEVFHEVGIPEKRYKRKVSKMFSTLEGVLKKIKAKSKDLTKEEVTTAFSLERTRYLVRRYGEYKHKKDKISERLNLFMDIVNNLFEGRKVFYITDSNEISFLCGKRGGMSLYDLSSGEKQLIILLGEVLLNGEKQCLYIADEPEISLHVTWQEALAKNIFALNPNVQILFATHSPDIVSEMGSKVIKIEAAFTNA